MNYLPNRKTPMSPLPWALVALVAWNSVISMTLGKIIGWYDKFYIFSAFNFPFLIALIFSVLAAILQRQSMLRLVFTLLTFLSFIVGIVRIVSHNFYDDYLRSLLSSFGFPISPDGFPLYLHSIDKLVIFSMFNGIASIAIVILVILNLVGIKTSKPLGEIQTPFNNPTIALPEKENNTMTQAVNNSQGAQWLVKLPGQPDNSVDTPTLQMWARSGLIRPETLIVEVSSGMSYAASQIPGVFSTKSYVTALLLSFFVGTFGADRFYLGQTGLGIGKLLTLGGCGIWTLIDFILIAMRKVTDAQGNPLA